MKSNLIFSITFFIIIATTAISQTLKDTVVDIDGNVYHTVKIGTQVWMVENLNVIHYSNGDAISNVVAGAQWSKLLTGAYCNYKNDPNNAKTYGRLYNWFTVNDKRCIAPKGWHIPKFEEFLLLINFLGGENAADSKLKEIGTNHWKEENKSSTNESGFTALPGSSRNFDGSFAGYSSFGCWWSSSECLSEEAWYLNLLKDSTPLGYMLSHNSQNDGYSIRCIKD